MNNNLYNIDSKFRNKTSFPNSENFIFNKMEQIIGTDKIIEPFNEKNVIEIKISSLELPNTIYYITPSRGNITLTFGGAVTIDSGSYTIYELINHLNDLATSGSLAGLTFSYIATLSKVQISNLSATNLEFPSSGTDYPSLGDILGFTSTVIAGTIEQNGNNVIINPQQSYLFLRINDFGNIINKNNRYIGKIILNNYVSRSSEQSSSMNIDILTNQYKLITNIIKFDQPIDIPQLSISLEDEYGNLMSLNGGEWSFTLETTVINNTILKNYTEIKFYNDEVMDRILKAKMLSYYQKQIPDNENNSMASVYSSNIINLNNIQEYSALGNSNNYNPLYSYFKEDNFKKDNME